MGTNQFATEQLTSVKTVAFKGLIVLYNEVAVRAKHEDKQCVSSTANELLFLRVPQSTIGTILT